MNNQFSTIIQDFFIKYLSSERGISENTIKTYRDTFVQLFEYMQTKQHIKPQKIKVENLNNDTIIEFLNWLEFEKHVSISTRNNRLAAIRSLFKYISYHYPMYLNQSRSILDIKNKKCTSKPMNYLTIEAIKNLFSVFDTNDIKDLRRLAIISLLYESGARVSELINIRTYELKLTTPHTLILHGKGNKSRIIPIDESVIQILQRYINEYHINNQDYLFQNSQGNKLNRKGITYILETVFNRAKSHNQALYPEHISPHCMRHSKAMHLLENGVNLIYIRDFLGHSSVTTTEIYSKANPEIKRKYLLKASNQLIDGDDYTNDEKDALLEWLNSSL